MSPCVVEYVIRTAPYDTGMHIMARGNEWCIYNEYVHNITNLDKMWYLLTVQYISLKKRLQKNKSASLLTAKINNVI